MDRHPYCTDDAHDPRHCPTCATLHAYDEAAVIPAHRLFLGQRAEVERLRAALEWVIEVSAIDHGEGNGYERTARAALAEAPAPTFRTDSWDTSLRQPDYWFLDYVEDGEHELAARASLVYGLWHWRVWTPGNFNSLTPDAEGSATTLDVAQTEAEAALARLVPGVAFTGKAMSASLTDAENAVLRAEVERLRACVRAGQAMLPHMGWGDERLAAVALITLPEDARPAPLTLAEFRDELARMPPSEARDVVMGACDRAMEDE